MKVAIIGAGPAGLACAHELERYGIKPVIYERNSFIGDQYEHVGVILEIMHRPIRDPLEYFKKQFELDIKPINTVNNLVHYSPNKVTAIKGNFGYFIKRNRDADSFFNQIYSQLKNSKIIFNENADYETLSKKYDYVVIANGNPSFAEELGCWQEWVKTYVRGAVALGDFDPNTLVMWINKDYCKNGYAYMAPFNDKKSSIAMVVTDVNEKEVDHYWELFLYTRNIKYTIIEEFKLEHKSGYVYPHKTGNLLFAGNAGGSIDPFLGFGQLISISMGVCAARSIAKGEDYEELLKGMIKKNLQLWRLRKGLDTLTNRDYDILVSLLGLPGIKQLIYDTPLDVVKYGSHIIGLISGSKFYE